MIRRPPGPTLTDTLFPYTTLFRSGRALLVPLDLDAPHENGARVEPDSADNMVQVGDSLMGRVVDAMGMPLDRKGPIMANAYWPLAGVKGNVLDRGRVTEPFDLGVRAVKVGSGSGWERVGQYG